MTNTIEIPDQISKIIVLFNNPLVKLMNDSHMTFNLEDGKFLSFNLLPNNLDL